MAIKQVVVLKDVDLSVENGVDVADFRSGAMILDQPVGLQRIGPDLAAEGDGVLAGIFGLSFGFAFLQLQIVQPGPENAQR